MAERWRWLALTLSLIFAFGGGLFVTLLIVEGNQRASQRDFCEFLDAFDNPSAPPPTTDRGRAQASAWAQYREKRC